MDRTQEVREPSFMRRHLLSIAAATGSVVGAGIAGVIANSGESTVSLAAGAELSSELQVTCDGESMQLNTDNVEARRDGVHIRVVPSEIDPLKRALHIEPDPTNPDISQTIPGGYDLEQPWMLPDEGETMSLRPGGFLVACADASTEVEYGQAAFTVEDSAGLWQDSTPMVCEEQRGAVVDYFRAIPEEDRFPQDLLQAARQGVMGGFSQPGDQIRVIGYPEASPAIVQLIRKGQTIVEEEYRRTGKGSWIVHTISACADIPFAPLP